MLLKNEQYNKLAYGIYYIGLFIFINELNSISLIHIIIGKLFRLSINILIKYFIVQNDIIYY